MQDERRLRPPLREAEPRHRRGRLAAGLPTVRAVSSCSALLRFQKAPALSRPSMMRRSIESSRKLQIIFIAVILSSRASQPVPPATYSHYEASLVPVSFPSVERIFAAAQCHERDVPVPLPNAARDSAVPGMCGDEAGARTCRKTGSPASPAARRARAPRQESARTCMSSLRNTRVMRRRAVSPCVARPMRARTRRKGRHMPIPAGSSAGARRAGSGRDRATGR